MKNPLYLEDSYLKSFETVIIQVIDSTHVVLEDTIFYAQGGGQPSDTGALVRVSDNKEFAVVIVKKKDGQIVHEVAEFGLEEGDNVLCSLDWEKRYKLMRMHTAVHILSAIIYKHTGALITGNQLGEEKSRMDFNLERFDRAAFAGYIEEANAAIAEGAEVTVSSMSREAALQIPHMVKLAGKLPPVVKELRIVKIGDIDEEADGGTHVKDAKEVGKIELLSLDNKGKNNRRLYFTLS